MEKAVIENKKAFFRCVLDHVSDAVVTTDEHGRVTFANPAAEHLYGLSEAQALGRGLGELLRGFNAGAAGNLADITGAVARDGRWHGEIMQRTPDRPELLVEASISLLRHDGNVVGSVSVVREVSDRRAAEQLIAYQATHDGLTGLLNRAAWMAALETALTSRRAVVVVFVDLNGSRPSTTVSVTPKATRSSTPSPAASPPKYAPVT